MSSHCFQVVLYFLSIEWKMTLVGAFWETFYESDVSLWMQGGTASKALAARSGCRSGRESWIPIVE